jgi:hypothetical protein
VLLTTLGPWPVAAAARATPGHVLSAQGAQAPAVPTLRASGRHLTLGGRTVQLTGVNAYELATDWGTNAGCGGMLTDAQLTGFFASLPPNSLVRFWAYQGSMAVDVDTHQLDWRPLDRVFAAAAAAHERLIVSVAGQGGTCDGRHWQDVSWYEGGYTQVFNSPSNTDGTGLDPLSYWAYLQDLVARYRSSPALGMWEPVSEAEASSCPAVDEPVDCSGHQTCPSETTAAVALRSFFDLVGARIHQIDPAHLVESGLLGGGQCGTQGADYQYVQASPGVDVLSYHDYGDPAVALGGDPWNGLAVRFAQAATLDKPIIGGEVGITAGPAPGCTSSAGRAADLGAKMQAQLAAGSSALLPWDWVPSTTGRCSFDIAPGDAVLTMMAAYPLER